MNYLEKISIKKQSDHLIFPKDSILKPMNILSKLLRKIFYLKKITYHDFYDIHENYSKAIGLNKNETYSDRNNLLKGITNEMITFRIFKIVLNKLGYFISGLSVQLYNQNTGETETYEIKLNREKNE